MIRHKRRKHREQEPDSMELSDTPSSDLSDTDSTDKNDTEDQLSDGSESEYKYDPWESLITRTFDECREEFQEYVDNLIQKRHMEQTEARRRAYKDLQSTFRKTLGTLFKSRIMWTTAMKKDPIYKSILKTVNNLIDLEDYERPEAWKYAIGKRKYLFDAVLEKFEPPSFED